MWRHVEIVLSHFEELVAIEIRGFWACYEPFCMRNTIVELKLGNRIETSDFLNVTRVVFI